jgi:hypothetical protein
VAGDLKIVLAKLDRAKAHAEAFDGLVREFQNRKPHAIAMHTDPEPPHWVHFQWQVKETPPVDFALILGDLLSNLRATLDYLVWQLVLAAGNTPTDRNAFPCVKQGTNWPSVRGDRLQGVDACSAAEIDKLQPYHRTQDPERHLLAVLDRINNLNKHRALPTVVVTVPTWRFLIGGDIGGREIEQRLCLDHPIEDGVEFASYRFTPPLDHEVTYQSDPPFRIAFRDGLDHSDGWTYTNADLIGWVEMAISVLKPALPR